MAQSGGSGEVQTFKFKKPSRKPLRQRIETEEDDANDDGNSDVDILYVNVKVNEIQYFN